MVISTGIKVCTFVRAGAEFNHLRTASGLEHGGHVVERQVLKKGEGKFHPKKAMRAVTGFDPLRGASLKFGPPFCCRQGSQICSNLGQS